MGLGGYLLHQFARPHGRLAGVVAALMNRGNALINARAIAALQLADGVRVLEVGFGGAAALGTLLGDGRVSFAAGLDPSAELVRRAETRFAGEIAAGRLEVQLGTVDSVPWPAESFDRILSVNTIYYWREPARGMEQLFRVLRPHGLAVIALRSAATIARLELERHGYRCYGEREVEELLARAGFSAVHSELHEDRPYGGIALVRAEKAP